ncbi:hypothetical protein BIW11_12761, partial [Tropilaelaps mercedesae]
VKPRISQQITKPPQSSTSKLKTPKRPPSSSSSSSDSGEELKPNAKAKGKMGGSDPKKTPTELKDKDADNQKTAKRKRNSILPRVTENPWKRKTCEVRNSSSDEAQPAKAAKIEATNPRSRDSTSSESEIEQPARTEVKKPPTHKAKASSPSSSDQSSSSSSDEKSAKNVSPILAERRVKNLLEKGQRHAAGLKATGDPGNTAKSDTSDSSSDSEAEVTVVKTEPSKSLPFVKASPSSDSDSDSSDDVKPRISQQITKPPQSSTSKLKIPKRPPSSSSSSSDSGEDLKPNAKAKGKMGGSDPKKTPTELKDKDADNQKTAKRKRNSILPRVTENPWKRKTCEVRNSSSDEAQPAKAAKIEATNPRSRDSTSSESEIEQPARTEVYVSPITPLV